MKFLAVSSIALLFIGQAIAKPAEGCLKNYTITDIDSCVSVAAKFKLLEADFYRMNPGLHHSAAHDCDNLDTGRPFCVCMKEPCSSGVAIAAAPAAPAALAAPAAPAAPVVAGASSNSAAISTIPSASGIPSPRSGSTVATSSSPSNKDAVVARSTQSQTASRSSAGSTTTIFGVAAIGMAFAATSLLL